MEPVRRPICQISTLLDEIGFQEGERLHLLTQSLESLADLL